MSLSTRAGRLSLVVACVLAAGSGTGIGGQEATLESCVVEGFDGAAECGLVPYEHAGTGGKRAVYVVRLPATSEDGPAAPLFPLVGGPGQAATEYVSQLALGFAETRRRSDLVFIDLPGTGRFGGLRCVDRTQGGDPLDALRAYEDPQTYRDCLATLAEDMFPAEWTTIAAAAAINEVRSALGYDEINLWAGSYGTRLGAEVIRRYGDTVRAAVFEGVSLAAHRFFEVGPAAFERVLAEVDVACRDDPNCSAAFPHFLDDVRELSRMLGEGDVDVEVTMFVREPVVVRVDRGSAMRTIRAMLYANQTIAMLPLVVRDALENDLEPLATFMVEYAAGLAGIYDGMLMSVRCAELLAFMDGPAGRRAGEASLLGTGRLGAESEICGFWPHARLPTTFRDVIATDVPVLMLSGSWDVATPPEMSRSAAASFTDSRFLSPSRLTHAVSAIDPCYYALRTRFFETARFEQLDFACVETVEIPPFLTKWPGRR